MTHLHLIDDSILRSIREVPELITRDGFRRIFFVCDESAYKGSGADLVIGPLLGKMASTSFLGFELNPKIEDIERGVKEFREFNPDLVIALGGGSAIDIAKAISFVGSSEEANARAVVQGRQTVARASVPILAIPTTAGTGSEATHFAVVYIENRKYSLATQQIKPKHVVLDHSLTKSLPKHVTAASGLDALCQAIESLWSVRSTEESRSYAAAALKLAWNTLETVVVNPDDVARKTICEASYLAGKAIDISKTTGPHALSYKLTSDFQVPHGYAVGVFLAPFFQYNASISQSDCNDMRGVEFVREQLSRILKATNCSDQQEFCEKFMNLLKRIGAPILLRDVGITSGKEIESFVAKANMERLSNNPRSVCKETFSKHLLDFQSSFGCVINNLIKGKK